MTSSSGRVSSPMGTEGGLYVLVARHVEDGYEVVTKFPLSKADMEARMAPLVAEPSEWTYFVCRLDFEAAS